MSGTERQRGGTGRRLLGCVYGLCGLGLAVPGALLCSLGGSPYYLAVGIALAVCGVLFWLSHRSARWLFLLILVITTIWAVWEVGADGWALLPRLDLVVLLGILLVLTASQGSLDPTASRGERSRAIAVGALVVAILIGGLMLIGGRRAHAVSESSYDGKTGVAAVMAGEDGEWPRIGGDANSGHFSALRQITPENVTRLEVAWKIHVGMLPPGVPGALEATPLKIGETLYTCDMRSVVLAIDVETGATRWRFDPQLDDKVINLGVCRGVTYYKLPNVTGPCSERIFDSVYDGRIVALDALSGQLCEGFGAHGEVSLLEGMGQVDRGYYYLTSPATLVRNRLIVGGSVLDGQKINEPSGVIRAYDAVTGQLTWAWDMGRPNSHGLPPLGETYTQGSPNAWPPMAGDDALGLVFVPLGNATPDYVSAHRTPEMNEYNSSVVALDVENGSVRWHFQTTHNDVWDYDNPSAPTLAQFSTSAGVRPALIQPTKRGQFFVLDRETGQPLVDTVEKPVPQNPVPGERLSPTQPYPIGMPSFGGERLTEAHMWGLTPFDQLWCRIKFREARYDGDFTPLGLSPSIVYPGYLGGSEWGGVAVDPGRHIMVLNVNHFPMYDQLVRREDANPDVFKPMTTGVDHYNARRTTQQGTPYAAVVAAFVSPLGVPCNQPPYSEVAAVDLETHKTIWRKPLGTSRDSGPFGMASMLPIPMGVPAVGGALVTRSGLIFIAATQERSLRAFDIKSGRLLWSARLPAGGHMSPMSYYSTSSGRQFVVVAASGHPLMSDGNADFLIAYALPH